MPMDLNVDYYSCTTFLLPSFVIFNMTQMSHEGPGWRLLVHFIPGNGFVNQDILYHKNNFSSVLCATLCYPMTYSHWNQFFMVAYICMCISYVTKLSFRLQHHVFPYFQCFARFILLMKVPWVSVKSMHEWLWLISIFWNIFRTNILLRYFLLWITIVMKSNRIPE